MIIGNNVVQTEYLRSGAWRGINYLHIVNVDMNWNVMKISGTVQCVIAGIKMKCLIDSDYYLYALGALKDEDGEPREFRFIANNFEQQIHKIKSKVEEKFDVEAEVEIHISGPTNFRSDIATILPYKGNRTGKEKPHHYETLKRYITEIAEHPVVISDNCEADDEVSIRQYSAEPETTVICSPDKDLKMVPGWNYDYKKDTFTFINSMDSRRWFYSQLLMGDSVDNIHGLYNVGIKSDHIKKLHLMDTEKQMYDHVRKLYRKYYGDYADQFLLEVGRLLWMQEYRGQLWQPPEN